jgi:hypothetical protein
VLVSLVSKSVGRYLVEQDQTRIGARVPRSSRSVMSSCSVRNSDDAFGRYLHGLLQQLPNAIKLRTACSSTVSSFGLNNAAWQRIGVQPDIAAERGETLSH